MKRENLIFALEVTGIIGGIATILALMLGPMFYLGTKIDDIKTEMHSLRVDMHKEGYELRDRISSLHRKLERHDVALASLDK